MQLIFVILGFIILILGLLFLELVEKYRNTKRYKEIFDNRYFKNIGTGIILFSISLFGGFINNDMFYSLVFGMIITLIYFIFLYFLIKSGQNVQVS